MGYRAGTCPVCGQSTNLVEHHDHFGDFCYDLLNTHQNRYNDEWYLTFRATPWWIRIVIECSGPSALNQHDPLRSTAQKELIHLHQQNALLVWETFPNIFICPRCNAICPAIKKNFRYLPKCVSFSPYEMNILQYHETIPRLSLCVAAIWEEKREQYRPRLQKLVEMGLAKDTIAVAWNDRTVPINTTKVARDEMLQLYQRTPSEFKRLCSVPGNDAALARIMVTFSWPLAQRNSFIYWYHKRHGDPGCKKNQFGITPTSFTEWFLRLTEGKEDEARAALQHGIYWRDH